VTIRTFLVVALALIFGVSAMIGVQAFIRKPAPQPDKVSVVVASVAVERYATLSQDMLTTRDFPREMAPPEAITTIEDALERKALQQLAKGELILNGKLAARGAGPGIASEIPRGMEAFTLHIPAGATGVAGPIIPGNRVNVLLTVTRSEGAIDRISGGRTTRLLQNVKVLAVDHQLDPLTNSKNDMRDLRWVTLLVTAEQANRLALALNKGVLQLTLRNTDDNQLSGAPDATPAALGYLTEKKETVTVNRKTPPKARIRTMRGSWEGTVEIEPDEEVSD
jgi:pilus assembly protein CpaB